MYSNSFALGLLAQKVAAAPPRLAREFLCLLSFIHFAEAERDNPKEGKRWRGVVLYSSLCAQSAVQRT